MIAGPSLLAELKGLADFPAPVPPIAPGRVFHVYVADWGYHTSITIEQPAGWNLGPPGREHAPFLEYAWGDRRYYMLEDHGVASTLKALFLPTPSVLYLEGHGAPPSTQAGARAVFARTVRDAELRVLVAELEGAMPRSVSAGRPVPYAPAPGYDGRFYPARGTYLWWFDCNRWTVDRLARAGFARSGRGVITSGQVGGRLLGFSPVTPRS